MKFPFSFLLPYFPSIPFLAVQGVNQLALALSEESEDHIKAATVWSIGQIGRHTPEHAKAVALANLLPKLLELYMEASSSEDLQTKVTLPPLVVVHLHPALTLATLDQGQYFAKLFIHSAVIHSSIVLTLQLFLVGRSPKGHREQLFVSRTGGHLAKRLH